MQGVFLGVIGYQLASHFHIPWLNGGFTCVGIMKELHWLSPLMSRVAPAFFRGLRVEPKKKRNGKRLVWVTEMLKTTAKACLKRERISYALMSEQ